MYKRQDSSFARLVPSIFKDLCLLNVSVGATMLVRLDRSNLVRISASVLGFSAFPFLIFFRYRGEAVSLSF